MCTTKRRLQICVFNDSQSRIAGKEELVREKTKRKQQHELISADMIVVIEQLIDSNTRRAQLLLILLDRDLNRQILTCRI